MIGDGVLGVSGALVRESLLRIPWSMLVSCISYKILLNFRALLSFSSSTQHNTTHDQRTVRFHMSW